MAAVSSGAAASGGTPATIPTGPAAWIDINHAVSPDGKSLAFTAGSIWKVPARGGEPISITAVGGSYVHGWSPDGKWLVFSANRGHGLDLFRISADGLSDQRLTSSPRAEDAASYSPDGHFIYFLSDRGGNRDIWRMPASGAGPGDGKAEQITSDDREDAAPRCSPDGKWLFFLSYPPRTHFNAIDRDVLIRRVALIGGRPMRAKPTEIARIVGGHGTLGSRPFSPDGRRLAYASFEPPPPTIRLVLFTASDRTPPADAPRRLTRIADAAERFFFSEMKRWKYPAAASRLFRRNTDGTVEVTCVKGDHPASDRVYEKPECGQEAREKARQQLRLEGEGHIFLTFVYLGDRPQRFGNWAGNRLRPRRGLGGCQLRHDSRRDSAGPRPRGGFQLGVLLEGDNPRAGPRAGAVAFGTGPATRDGQFADGPNVNKFVERKQPHADQVYLNEASAAILWKHPVFSGTSKDRQRQPTVTLLNYKPAFSRASNRITLTGKLVSDMGAQCFCD